MTYEFDNEKHENSFNVAYSTIVGLSNSQGIYSRLRYNLELVNWLPLVELTMDVYFEDALDFVMYMER